MLRERTGQGYEEMERKPPLATICLLVESSYFYKFISVECDVMRAKPLNHTIMNVGYSQMAGDLESKCFAFSNQLLK